MKIILVRHGHAGRKTDWHRPDRLRPLSPRGLGQAEALVELVAPLKPKRVISSPLKRCLQTAEPIAAALGLKLERSSALVPDGPTKALRLLRRLSTDGVEEDVVLVTHGEVMGEVLRKVAKDDGVQCSHRLPGLKGCAWNLDFFGGQLVAATYIPPP